MHSLEEPLPANAVYIFNSTHIHEPNQDHCGGQNSGELEQQEQYLRQARRGKLSSRQEDDDDYFDGLGRLYDLGGESLGAGEGEGPKEGHSNLASALQTHISPCPPLQPADY